MRSSCEASARNRRSRSSPARCSANARSSRASISLKAMPSRPTSVRSSVSSTRWDMSPAAISRAVSSIRASGRSPARTAQSDSAASAARIARLTTISIGAGGRACRRARSSGIAATISVSPSGPVQRDHAEAGARRVRSTSRTAAARLDVGRAARAGTLDRRRPARRSPRRRRRAARRSSRSAAAAPAGPASSPWSRRELRPLGIDAGHAVSARARGEPPERQLGRARPDRPRAAATARAWSSTRSER